MVLEEATNSSPETSFSENPPSSDADPYYGDSNPTYLDARDSSYIAVNKAPHTIYVNTDQLPKRFTFVGAQPIPKQLVSAIQEACRQSSVAIGRPLKQEEADAMSYHYARALKTASYGQPLGLAVGAFWAYRGHSKYRFPGWTPGEKFNPNKLGPLTGRRAQILWQVLRYQLYTFVGATVGGLFMSSYALTQGVTGRMMDPRLKEIVQSLSDQSRVKQRQNDEQYNPREETSEMARQRRAGQEAIRMNRQRQQQQQQQQSRAQGDDMSPSGGAFGAEYIDLGSATVSDTSMMSDSQAKQQLERMESQQKADYARRSAPERSVAASRQQSSDDTSPTSQPSGQRQGGGSAWERLRQQAASGNQQQSSSRNAPQAQSRDGSSNGDSFSFSSNDEDRQLARTEAQKEFDSRVDREREGRDFEDRKRW